MIDVTRIYKRSDALYYSTIKRRELCDMIAHLESDLEQERERSERYKKATEDRHDKESTA